MGENIEKEASRQALLPFRVSRDDKLECDACQPQSYVSQPFYFLVLGLTQSRPSEFGATRTNKHDAA